jgi:hypothetical protein
MSVCVYAPYMCIRVIEKRAWKYDPTDNCSNETDRNALPRTIRLPTEQKERFALISLSLSLSRSLSLSLPLSVREKAHPGRIPRAPIINKYINISLPTYVHACAGCTVIADLDDRRLIRNENGIADNVAIRQWSSSNRLLQSAQPQKIYAMLGRPCPNDFSVNKYNNNVVRSSRFGLFAETTLPRLVLRPPWKDP